MHKKTFIIIAALVVLCAAGGIAIFMKQGKDNKAVPAVTIQPSVVISMTKDGFSPNTATIKVGQAVKFDNASLEDYFWPASDLHPTHELYPEFDPRIPIGPSESWTFVFERAGTWSYHDHLFSRRKGIITVTE